VGKSRRLLRDFSKHLWKSPLPRDFHRCGIFHQARPLTGAQPQHVEDTHLKARRTLFIFTESLYSCCCLESCWAPNCLAETRNSTAASSELVSVPFTTLLCALLQDLACGPNASCRTATKPSMHGGGPGKVRASKWKPPKTHLFLICRPNVHGFHKSSLV